MLAPRAKHLRDAKLRAPHRNGHIVRVRAQAPRERAAQRAELGEQPRTRTQAAAVGVIEATVAAMLKYEESPIAPNIIVALRLVVDRLPDQRQRATALGAKADWVKPVTKEGGGSFLSFRSGFGTNRSSNRDKTPPKVIQASTLGGIQEEES